MLQRLSTTDWLHTVLGGQTHAHVIGPLALEQVSLGNLALLTLVSYGHLVRNLFKLFDSVTRVVFRSLLVQALVYGSWIVIL